MDLNLAGRSAFVTGASVGIGREVARHLAREGAEVAIMARGRARLQQAACDLGAETGRRVLAVCGDTGVPEDVERCVHDVLEAFGRIDILVTCAGGSPRGRLDELTEEQWMYSLNTKFMGYVRTVRTVVPHMISAGGGSIVLVVGNSGLKPGYWELAAATANAADLNFAAAIADQYGEQGVRINTVNPGPVDTDRWDVFETAYAQELGIDRAQARRRAEASIPLGRITRPGEVAALVTFVASDVAASIHGTHILIDGAQRKSVMEPRAARHSDS